MKFILSLLLCLNLFASDECKIINISENAVSFSVKGKEQNTTMITNINLYTDSGRFYMSSSYHNFVGKITCRLFEEDYSKVQRYMFYKDAK